MRTPYSLPKMTHVSHRDKILYIISWYVENMLDPSMDEPLPEEHEALHLNDFEGPVVAWSWEALDNPRLLWGEAHSAQLSTDNYPSGYCDVTAHAEQA